MSVDSQPTQVLFWSHSIEITGKEFQDSPNLEIHFGDKKCPEVVFHNSETLHCRGLHEVPVSAFTLTVVSGSTSISVTDVRFGNPIITHVVSSVGAFPTSGGVSVVIYGANFENNTSMVYWNDEILSNFVFVSPTQIQFVLPRGANSARVHIENGQHHSPVFVLHYDHPVVVGVSSTHGFPNVGGVYIEIVGHNFPILDDQVQVFISEMECTNVTVNSTTSLSCLLPRGTGAMHPVVIKSPLSESLPARVLHYNNPEVLEVTGEFNTRGGNLVHIRGNDFGFAESSVVSVRIGHASCSEPRYVNDSVVTCRLPSNKGTGLAVTVTVDGLVSLPGMVLNYDPPVIERVSPLLLSLSSPLVIYGKNLYTDSSMISLEFSPHLRCTEIVVVTPHEAIECRGFSSIGAEYYSGYVEITMKVFVAQQASNQFSLLLGPALLSFSSEEYPCNGGDVVTLTGLNFHLGTPSIIFESLPEGNFTRQVDSLTLVNSKTMSFELPPGFGPFEIKFFMNDSFVSSLHGSYDAPVVSTAFSPSKPTSGNVTVEIEGKNFFGVDAPVTVAFNDQSVDDLLVYDDGFLTFTLPKGSGNVPLVVSLLSKSSRTFDFTYDAPKIELNDYFINERLVLNYTNDNTIELGGQNFGDQASLISISLNSSLNGLISCKSIEIITAHTHVSCSLESIVSGPLLLSMEVNGLSSEPLTDIYMAPKVISLTHEEVLTDGSSNAILTGINLDLLSSTDLLILVNDIELIPSSISADAIVFIIPQGCGVDIPVLLSSPYYVSSTYYFSYDSPSIISLSADSLPTSGGVPVILKAKNIGPCIENVSLIFDGSPIEFSILSTINQELEFVLPSGSGTSLLKLSLLDRSSEDFELHYDKPVITSVRSDSGFPTSGGVQIQIIGSNFGDDKYSIEVIISGNSCVVTALLSDYRINCTLPQIQGSVNVLVAVNGKESSPFEISSDAPVVTNPKEGDIVLISGGLKIIGENFGSKVDEILVFLGPFSCPTIVVNTEHKEISCLGLNSVIAQESEPVSSLLQLKVIVSGQETTVDEISIGPSILSIKPPTGKSISTLGNVILTIQGISFPTQTPLLYFNSIEIPIIDYSGNTCTFKLPPGFLPSTVSLKFGSYQTDDFVLHYDPPKITKLVFPNEVVPTKGDVKVGLVGQNFGDVSLVLEYVFDLDPLSTVYSVQTSIDPELNPHQFREFTLFPGFGQVQITPILQQVRGNSFKFRYEQPKYTKIHFPHKAPTQGNVPVYLHFINFPPQVEPFNSIEINARVLSRGEPVMYEVFHFESESVIQFNLEAGVGTRTVLIESDWMPLVEATITYDPPSINHILPIGAINLSEPITIQGENFGVWMDEIQVTISDLYICTDLVMTKDHSELQCNKFEQINSSIEINLASLEPLLQVTVAGQSDTAQIAFIPSILSHSTKAGARLRHANNLIISGFGFNRLVSPLISFGGISVVPTRVTDQVIEVLLPSWSSSYSVPVVVFDGDRVVSQFDFTFDAPAVDELKGHLLPGEEFLIAATNLPDIENAEISVKYLENTVDCVYEAEDELRCIMPSVDCLNETVLHLSVNNHDIIIPFNVSTPFITSLSSLPAVEGSTIIIDGSFGSSAWTRYVYVDDNAISFTYLSHNNIEATIPPGEGQNELKIVTCSDHVTVFNFTYQPPTLVSFESGSPRTLGGFYTIQGFGFSSNMVAHTEARYLSSTKIQVLIPEGSGTQHALSVSVGGLSSNDFFYSYQPPTVESISKVSKNGGRITIKGTNFGPSVDHIDEILVGAFKCKDPKMSDPHRTISCYAPSKSKLAGNMDGNAVVIVSIGGQTATSMLEYSGKATKTILNINKSLFIGLIVLLAIGLFSGAFFVRPVRAFAQRVLRTARPVTRPAVEVIESPPRSP
ncbi:hypothetical protein RCL1_008543 [Eukaryota sp. TZLM3-RCL]